MQTPGARSEQNPVSRLGPFQHLPVGDGRFAVRDDHSAALTGRQRQLDPTIILQGRPVHPSEVFLVDLPIPKRRRQGRCNRTPKGEEEHARGARIEAMYQPQSAFPAVTLLQLRPESLQGSAHGSRTCRGRWHGWRLVDRQQCTVLVDDRQRAPGGDVPETVEQMS